MNRPSPCGASPGVGDRSLILSFWTWIVSSGVAILLFLSAFCLSCFESVFAVLVAAVFLGALNNRNSNSCSSSSLLSATPSFMSSFCVWTVLSIFEVFVFWAVSNVEMSKANSFPSLACASSLSAISMSGELLGEEEGETISSRRILAMYYHQYCPWTGN